MSESPAPKRPWFRFRLRTLFVVVTVLACWLGYELNWIRQRHELLARPDVFHLRDSPSFGVNLLVQPSVKTQRAPGLLWMLGESGVRSLDLPIAAERFHASDCPECQEKVDHAKSLFPEATYVEVYSPPDDEHRTSMTAPTAARIAL